MAELDDPGAGKRRLPSDTSCPHCGVDNPAGTNMGDMEPSDVVVVGGAGILAPGPSDGDLCICFSCVALNVATGFGMGVRAATDQEREAFLSDDRVINVIAMMMGQKA